MKKFIVIVCFLFVGSLTFAQHGPPPPRNDHRGNDGLYKAAAITSIVADSVSILSNLTGSRTTVTAQPVYVAPAAPPPPPPQDFGPRKAYAPPPPPPPQPRHNPGPGPGPRR